MASKRLLVCAIARIAGSRTASPAGGLCGLPSDRDGQKPVEQRSVRYSIPLNSVESAHGTCQGEDTWQALGDLPGRDRKLGRAF